MAASDPISDALDLFNQGLDGVTSAQAASRLTGIESLISGIAKQGKLYGRHFDDLLALKYLHQRYTNYVSWLGFGG